MKNTRKKEKKERGKKKKNKKYKITRAISTTDVHAHVQLETVTIGV